MCGDIPSRSASYVDWVRVWTPAPIERARRWARRSRARRPRRGQLRPPGAGRRPKRPLPPGNGEASGAVASQRFPGLGWFIRDSGNPASLYAFRLDGGGSPKVREVPVTGATNRDWEDLTYDVGPDGRGRLFIIESGQSGGDHFIYEVPEPDPGAARTAPARRYRYAFPNSPGQANTESAFMVGRPAGPGDEDVPRPHLPLRRPVDRTASTGPGSWARWSTPTACSVVRLSPDRRTMVAASHTQAIVYEGLPPATPIRGVVGRKPNRITAIDNGVNVEAGDWFPSDSCQLLLVAENRNTYQLRLSSPQRATAANGGARTTPGAPSRRRARAPAPAGPAALD